jgi:YHS domain-containing protein
MTTARQERKSHRWAAISAVSLGAVLSAAVGGLCLAPPPSRAATTELVIADRHSGLAISGFDPVAYHTDAAAKVGRAELEYRFAGVTWRFANEGNRAAFAANPEVFMPRFGGYDPVAIARGASTPGHPELWLIVEHRLYLFYSQTARATFAADPDGANHLAERRWPDVLQTLTP